MATSVDYITFVCEQLAPFGAIRSRRMFGEYIVYLRDKPILSVCDNTVFVKMLPQLRPLMAGADCGFPYPGAKEHYILDIEDTNRLQAVIPLLEKLTPQPKSRKK